MPKKYKQLKTIEPSESLSAKLRAEIKQTMRAVFFEPLRSEFKAIRNNATSKSKLVRKVESGDLQYVGGAFTGKLDAATGKALKELGARFDKRRRAWVIAQPRLPADLQAAVTSQIKQREALEQAARESIAAIQERAKRMIEKVDFTPNALANEEEVDDRVLASLADDLAVQPKLDAQQKEALRKSYTENVKLSIQNFVDEEVLRFRKNLLPKIKQGINRGDLIDYVQARLKVGDSRAAFIAKQETSLFTSQTKQLLYVDAGVTMYRWSAIGGKAGDGRTRDSHAAAHGKLFYWDKDVGPDGARKPIDTDGKAKNPGMAFACRCRAVPIIERIT